MNKSFAISSLCVVSATLGLSTLAGNVSASTRTVCGFTGTIDAADDFPYDHWIINNCSMDNNFSDSGPEALAKFSLPVDAGASLVSGRVFVTGGDGIHDLASRAQLISFNDSLVFAVGPGVPTTTPSIAAQALNLMPLGSPGLPLEPTHGTATIIVTVPGNIGIPARTQTLYNVEMSQN